MIHVREGEHVITPENGNPSEWVAQNVANLGMLEVVGPTQAEIMLRAKNAGQYNVNAPHLATSGEKERLAAARLVARNLLVWHFPGAGPGHPLRRYYRLTEHGRVCWLLVRGEKS